MAAVKAKPLAKKSRRAAAKPAAPVAESKPSAGATKRPRIFSMSFASVYPLYVQKAERKGRTRGEVDRIIAWLTGYAGARLQRVIERQLDFETFFAQAPRLNPNAALITGVVCGMRVEEIDDPLMQQIRYLDKLIDELARGKKMESILRP
jgi:hypothetical protein